MRRDHKAWRYFMTAPDADTVDEWWRDLSENKKLSSEGWERHAPDWYSYDYAWPESSLPEWKDRIIWNRADDHDGRTMRVISHQQQRVDYRSGDSYYIRSKSDPGIYWVVFGGQVLAGSPGRTRFVVKMEKTDDDKDDDAGKKVMINKDSISITVASDPTQKVRVAEDGLVTVGGGVGGGGHGCDHGCGITFGQLKGSGFLAEGTGNEQGVAGWNALKRVSGGSGEEWELVR